MSQDEKIILAIRVRGQVSVRPQIECTLDILKLGRLHQARVLKLTPSIQGMITKSKDYITWGEIDEDTAIKLLSKRGRLSGNRRLSDAYLKKNSSYNSIKTFAKALVTGKANISDVDGLKPVFRLSPPTRGFRGKRNLPVGMGRA